MVKWDGCEWGLPRGEGGDVGAYLIASELGVMDGDVMEGVEAVGPPVEVKEFLLDVRGVAELNDFSWDACDDGEGGHVVSDDGMGGDDSAIADVDTAFDESALADPDFVADFCARVCFAEFGSFGGFSVFDVFFILFEVGVEVGLVPDGLPVGWGGE